MRINESHFRVVVCNLHLFSYPKAVYDAPIKSNPMRRENGILNTGSCMHDNDNV